MATPTGNADAYLLYLFTVNISTNKCLEEVILLKRLIAFVLVSFFAIFNATACNPPDTTGSSVSTSPPLPTAPEFTEVGVSADRVITGKVLNGDADAQRIYVFLADEADGDVKNADITNRYKFDPAEGEFNINITEDAAQKAYLYLAPYNVDQTSRETVEKDSLTHTESILPPPRKDYIISYDYNDGSGRQMLEETVKRRGEPVKLILTIPVHMTEGYAFKGWGHNADDAEAQYAPGDNYSRDGDATLYAVWSAPPVTTTVAATTAAATETTAAVTETTAAVTEETANQTETTAAANIIPPGSFILFGDDGAEDGENAFEDTAYMGTDNGLDGSITADIDDMSIEPFIGDTAAKFTYKAMKKSHWAGVALLWEYQGWDASGPDLRAYSELSFWVCGNGGKVKFFVEGDGGAQKTEFVKLTDEWQYVTLELGKWDFINIPLGWACNEKDPNPSGGTITFWIDGVHFH